MLMFRDPVPNNDMFPVYNHCTAGTQDISVRQPEVDIQAVSKDAMADKKQVRYIPSQDASSFSVRRISTWRTTTHSNQPAIPDIVILSEVIAEDAQCIHLHSQGTG
jgi:hypothetical protein